MITDSRWIVVLATLGWCGVAGGEDVEVPTLRTGTASLPAPQMEVISRTSTFSEVPTDGYWLENAPINEIFQYLARYADVQFFNNNELNDPKYNVTGNLKLTDANRLMDELAIAHGLTVYRQGLDRNVQQARSRGARPLREMGRRSCQGDPGPVPAGPGAVIAQ